MGKELLWEMREERPSRSREECGLGSQQSDHSETAAPKLEKLINGTER
jgi:hypothetical protein